MATATAPSPALGAVSPTASSPGAQLLEGKFWYAGPISERKAERILIKSGQPGVFLVRTSLLPEADYVLSINKNGHDIWHYDISVLPSEECILNKYIFPNISEAITFYTENRIGGIFLEEPDEPIISPKEISSNKTSTLVRRAPVSSRSPEPRVSGQYASSLGTETERSDDTLSMDSSTCAHSSSNVHIDWIGTGEEPNINGDQTSSSLHNSLENKNAEGSIQDNQSENMHWQQHGVTSDTEHQVTSGVTDHGGKEEIFAENYGKIEDLDETGKMNERVIRIASLVRQTSRAEQLKELKKLPSIQKKLHIIQRKMEGEDIDDDTDDDEEDMESNSTASPVTIAQSYDAEDSQQQPRLAEQVEQTNATVLSGGRVLLKKQSGPPPPVPNRKTKVASQAIAAALRFTIPKPPPPEPQPEVQEEIHQERRNSSTFSTDDNDEDMPPPPPMSTHPEVIAARMSRDFSCDEAVNEVVEKVNEELSLRKEEEQLQNLVSPQGPELEASQSLAPPTGGAQSQNDVPIIITMDNNLEATATLAPPSVEGLPQPSPRLRRKKPVPQPRSNRSSLISENDVQQALQSSVLKKQSSMPDVRTIPLPSAAIEPLPQLQETPSLNASESSQTSTLTSPKPCSPRLQRKAEEIREDTLPPQSNTKDKIPSPSMLRHFYFSNSKMVSLPGESPQLSVEEQGADNSNAAIATEKLESPPPVLEVSSPTQVQTLVSCGPMNSRRQGPPLKKKRSIFRKK